MEYGVVSIVPALVVIIIALATRRTFEALVVGTFSAYVIIAGPGFLTAWLDVLFEVLTDYDVQWVIMVCGLFGSLIALLSACHGTFAFTEKIAGVCRSARSSLVITWVMGILIFIDDYLNIITLGTCMCPVTDRHGEPREATAYIIDSTGAPVCVLLPISTWAIFYTSIFWSQPETAALGYADGLSMYVHLIPYAFYPLFTLLVVLLFCLKLLPRLGRMKKAYDRIERGGSAKTVTSGMEKNAEGVPTKTVAGGTEKGTEKNVGGAGEKNAAGEYDRADKIIKEEDMGTPGRKGTVWDFLVPILLVIVLTIVCGEMMVGLIAAIVVCLVMYLPRKLLSLERFCDVFMKGFCNMIPTLAVVVAAFIMQHAADDIGLPAFVISVVEPFMSAALFPAIVFLVVAALTFVTGSNWGIPAVCVPIVIPLAASLDANMLLTLAAVLSAGTFGSHACFYSDATLLTSVSCGIDNMDHALSQFPYAMIGAALSFAAFLVCGIAGI